MSKFLILLLVLYIGAASASSDIKIIKSEKDAVGCKYIDEIERSKFIAANTPEQQLSMFKVRELIVFDSERELSALKINTVLLSRPSVADYSGGAFKMTISIKMYQCAQE
jgi:hypothetical protein